MSDTSAPDLATLLPNLRDVGGLRTADGLYVRSGRLYRSEAPVGTQAALALRQLGLETVLDLRFDEEPGMDQVADHAPPWRVTRVPIGNPGGEDERVLQQILEGTVTAFSVDELVVVYRNLLEEWARAWGAVVRHVAEPANAPTLIHCRAGKDRTGIAIALILSLLGVEEERVLLDYELTNERRSRARVEGLRAQLAAVGVDVADVAAMFGAPREALAAALRWVTEAYGSVEGYLTGPAGIDPAVPARLRRTLLVREPAWVSPAGGAAAGSGGGTDTPAQGTL